MNANTPPVKVVLIRLSDEESAYLDGAAERNQITASEYIRRLIHRDKARGEGTADGERLRIN